MSLTLNKNLEIPRKERGAPLDQGSEKLRGLIADLSEVADVDVSQGHSIITLIADVARSSSVMAIVFSVMSNLGIQVEMMSQGASKVPSGGAGPVSCASDRPPAPCPPPSR